MEMITADGRRRRRVRTASGEWIFEDDLKRLENITTDHTVLLDPQFVNIIPMKHKPKPKVLLSSLSPLLSYPGVRSVQAYCL
jgi:hypothetical protein